ncbi:hypothetical protein DAPPUDRAFT_302431 [Daphnia pulex]|uniref:Uncharacterized protein n=1 Tax=Daphnia pulex TaxID=6669 RepID=E9HN99_DAPPU|nr:hypothetical protein DAPPUDRAFT_302431 [Daphnia pulex]|eukprot:EFX66720.1 hypothetical protein DAPPUDRAFT_302431 [Daphnia pulex]
MPTTFCFLFSAGMGYMMHIKLTTRTRSKYVFCDFSFKIWCVCVMECGASQKGRRCFSLMTGNKETRN